MNRVLIATMLVAVLPAGAVVVPADAPQETLVERLLAGAEGQAPLWATLNGKPVPVEQAFALLWANDVPMPAELEGIEPPDKDLGIGVREAGADPCIVAGYVLANSQTYDGTVPPPALVNVQSEQVLAQEPASMGNLACKSGVYDTWLGTVSADVAPTAVVAATCLRGQAPRNPYNNGFWLSGHHETGQNCHGTRDFTSASLEGRVGHIDIVVTYDWGYSLRIAVLFGGTFAGPVGADAGPAGGADVVVANLA